MNIADNYINKLKDFDDATKKLFEDIKNNFSAIMASLLSESNVIKSIRWNQYSPHFNDGDDCDFCTTIADLEINEDEEIDGECDVHKFDISELTACCGDIIKTEEELKEYLEIIKYNKKYESSYSTPEIGKYGYMWNPDRNIKECDILNKIDIFLNYIPLDFFRNMFENHVTVTVYKDGTTSTNEYYHD